MYLHSHVLQVNRKANQLAQALLANGIQPDMPVGLLIDRSPTYVIASLATLKASRGAYLGRHAAGQRHMIALLLDNLLSTWLPSVISATTQHL